ncbi:hypothetical protein F4776DRAFT_669233 [Hypoxylon sp. NC0597]|nr:hypothetical protein F4776DRAFT_669233 [Hypoxylon sp. NC0597]
MSKREAASPYALPPSARYFLPRRPSPPASFPALPLRPSPNPSSTSPHPLLDQNPQVQQGNDSNASGDQRKISEEPRPYACTKCKYRAKRPSHLTEHEWFMHIGTICMFPGCTTTTGSGAGLRTHIIEKHIRKIEVKVRGQDGTETVRFKCSWPGFRNIEGGAVVGRASGGNGPGGLSGGPVSGRSHTKSGSNQAALRDEDSEDDSMPQVGGNAKLIDAIIALTQKVDRAHQSLTEHILEVGEALEKFGSRLRDVEKEVNRLNASHYDLKNTIEDHNKETLRSLSIAAPALSNQTPASPLLQPQDKRPANSDSSLSPPHKQRRID